jgi:hypothetical protein
LVGFDFRDRTEFAISDPFLSKRSTNLKAVAFSEGALCFVVNAYTGEPRRVISEFAAIKELNGNSVLLVVGVYDSGVVACLDLKLFARAVVADYVFVGPVGIGEGALGVELFLFFSFFFLFFFFFFLYFTFFSFFLLSLFLLNARHQ